MALKLKWKNPNTGATTIDIYRSDTENVDLTTPLVTLSNGELEYIDTTALFGKKYYYVWAVNTENDRVVSRPQAIDVADRRGPGSNVLQQGNENLGFFGTVQSADFIHTGKILEVAKTTTGIPTTVLYPLWYKFIRNGKVLFVPNQTLGKISSGWQSLYNAGLVYGEHGTGPTGAGDVDQLTTLEVNGDVFLVRCPTGYPEGLTWDAAGSSIDLDKLAEGATHYSEYDDLFLPMIAPAPLRQRLVTVGNESYERFFTGVYGSSSEYTVGITCKEIADVNYTLVRGGGWDTRYDTPNRVFAAKAQRIARSAASRWWPVLEYVGRTDEVDLSTL